MRYRSLSLSQSSSCHAGGPGHIIQPSSPPDTMLSPPGQIAYTQKGGATMTRHPTRTTLLRRGAAVTVAAALTLLGAHIAAATPVDTPFPIPAAGLTPPDPIWRTPSPAGGWIIARTGVCQGPYSFRERLTTVEQRELHLVTGLIESSLHLHRPHRLRHGRADRYLSTTQHPSLESIVIYIEDGMRPTEDIGHQPRRQSVRHRT